MCLAHYPEKSESDTNWIWKCTSTQMLFQTFHVEVVLRWNWGEQKHLGQRRPLPDLQPGSLSNLQILRPCSNWTPYKGQPLNKKNGNLITIRASLKKRIIWDFFPVVLSWIRKYIFRRKNLFHILRLLRTWISKRPATSRAWATSPHCQEVAKWQVAPLLCPSCPSCSPSLPKLPCLHPSVWASSYNSLPLTPLPLKQIPSSQSACLLGKSKRSEVKRSKNPPDLEENGDASFCWETLSRGAPK